METTKQIDPGAGYRLLALGEAVKRGDEYLDCALNWRLTNFCHDFIKVDGDLTYRRKVSGHLKAADDKFVALQKPPLGLRPRALAKEDRLNEVRAAIWRYVNAKLDVPAEWIAEYLELTHDEFMNGL